MAEARDDQAEGLRRMLAFSRARTIAVLAGTRGAGATSCVVNLAAALARQGSRVLVVDENFDANIAQALGLRPRFDLKHAIQGECALDDVLVQARDRITLLPGAGAVRVLPRLDAASQARAIDCFDALDELADVVLLDARKDACEPSPFAAASHEVIVVVSPGLSAITGGYAAVKRMSRTHGRKQFRLLVNRVRDDDTARVIETNMREVAQTRLGVVLQVMDAIPLDTAVVVSARRFCAAVEAAPTAKASRQFCGLAGSMVRWSAPDDDASGLDIFMQRAIYGSRLTAARAGA